MAKKIQTLYRGMQKLAKDGKFQGKFTVNQGLIKKLEAEGFMVVYPNYRQLHMEGAKRVTISWEDPSVTGDEINKAKELHDIAWRKTKKGRNKRLIEKINKLRSLSVQTDC